MRHQHRLPERPKRRTEEKEKMGKRTRGFSLIELLIVVAIILIIAAIAIPNLMRARMAANDSSAAASEHTIIVGEIGYYGAYPTQGYATLAQLGGSSTPCVPGTAAGCLIDNNLATSGGGAFDLFYHRGSNFKHIGNEVFLRRR